MLSRLLAPYKYLQQYNLTNIYNIPNLTFALMNGRSNATRRLNATKDTAIDIPPTWKQAPGVWHVRRLVSRFAQGLCLGFRLWVGLWHG